MRLNDCVCGSHDIARVRVLRRGWDILPARWWCECWVCGRRGPMRWTRIRAEKAWNGRDKEA